MTTCLQTTEVIFPCSYLVFHTLEKCPILPAGYPRFGFYTLVMSDGSKISWDFPNQCVSKITPDGVTYGWWFKPTLADAVAHSTSPGLGENPTFRFHKDGSVTSHCFGDNFYWGPDVEGVAEEPVESISCGCHHCRYSDWYDTSTSDTD